MMFPFGKQIVRETFVKGEENVSSIRKVGGTIANVIWFPFGFIAMLFSLAEMLVCFLSIIFIPVGIVLARSCYFMLFPIGAKVITKEEYQAIMTANDIERRNVYNSSTPASASIPGTKFCRNCGNQLNGGNNFCGKCGARIG